MLYVLLAILIGSLELTLHFETLTHHQMKYVKAVYIWLVLKVSANRSFNQKFFLMWGGCFN